MNISYPSVRCSILALIVAGILVFATENHGALAPVDIVQPKFPAGLMEQGIEGTAVITVTVTTKGTVGNCEIKSADHELFGEAAIAAVKQWTFTPHEVDGKPVEKRANIPFQFAISKKQKAAQRITRINEKYGREIFKPLDPDIPVVRGRSLSRKQRPRPVKYEAPIYPPDLKGSGKTGRAVVKYTLDVDGKAINPEIIRSDDPTFTNAAFASVIMSEFEPIQKKGEPVYVEIQRSIDFSEDMNNRPLGGSGGGASGGDDSAGG